MVLTAIGECRLTGFTIAITRGDFAAAALWLSGWIALLVYCRYRIPKLFLPLQALIQTTIFGIFVLYLQYPMAALAPGTIDQSIIALDHNLGFDWPSLFRIINSHSLPQKLLRVAYYSLLVGLPVVILMVGLRDPQRLRRFVLANMLGQTLCVAISGIWPAAGALVTYRAAIPFLYNDYPRQFLGVRSGLIHTLHLPEMTGIIQFPSYHAMLATLIIYAVGCLPRWIAWPFYAYEATIIVSAPVEGGHYLTDIIGGVLGAIIATAAAEMLSGRPMRANIEIPVPAMQKAIPGDQKIV
jgi:membrane-associated phospholipid phosphatase